MAYLLAALAQLVAAHPASAHRAPARPRGFSLTPSTTRPYAACSRARRGRAACLAIVVPSTGSGGVSPSLRTGPSGQASPALQGGGVGGGFDPADLRSAYDLPSESAGAGQTVAIVDAYDDPNAESDLAVYRSRYGLPACTSGSGCFRKADQSGGTSYPKANAGWAVEISLDLDMASAACPQCHILLVEAKSNTFANLLTAEDEAVALGATEISDSWAGEEFPEETSLDSYFHHPGVPITAAAGDWGYGVEYPAASPYVIAVGGTVLNKAANERGWTETAWSETGSGCSEYEPKPSWQTDEGCSKRTNTDISAVASPGTPVSVADSYKLPAEFSQPEPGWTLVGGTSVSSPLIAGTLALSDAHTRSFTGANALYIEAAQNGTGVLDDVTSGSNGKCGGSYLCKAQPGYDGPTGLGSPWGAPVVLGVPTVETGAATEITETTATLNGSVNPNGSNVTECTFEYGLSASYGSTVPCATLPGSGNSPVAVSAPVTGLPAHATVYFRLAARNASGPSSGLGQTFGTLSGESAPEFGRCLKVAHGTGTYSNGVCTASKSSNSHEWYAAFGSSLPLGDTAFALALVGSGKPRLETTGKEKIYCTGQSGSGEYTGNKTLGAMTLTFTGCYMGSPSDHCQNAGQGEILSNSLVGLLGVVKEAGQASKDELGLQLKATSGELIAQFTCESTPVSVRGSVIVKVPANSMRSARKLHFAQSKGVQKLTHFVGGKANEDILEAKIGAGPYEQAGLALKTSQTGNEAVEANSVS